MSKGELAPIIIKRKKVIEGGHHGGAWKVAYADFVTAMMAFFLLMWLLNATTEKQRKGLADYFSPTIPIARISGGGDGSFSGDTVFNKEEFSQSGQGANVKQDATGEKVSGERGKEEDAQAQAQAQKAREKLEAVQNILMAKGGESMVMNEVMRHVKSRITDEGLIIEIFDLTDSPLFKEGSDEPMQITSTLASVFTTVFSMVENDLAVNGHLAAVPRARRENPVWELSTMRADRMRRLLIKSGFPDPRVQRVGGFADRKPASQDPMAVQNNRLELILLRTDLP
ncbi:MAG: flagellar motor protein MotB [Halocynthiibacter sp.]